MIDKLIFILAMIIVFYISVNSIQNFQIKHDTLESLVKEFSTGYIEDIIITDADECPQDYIRMIDNFDWPGSYKGCGCKEDGNVNYTWYNYCPRSNLACHAAPATEFKIMNKWRGKAICYKRSDVGYEDLYLVEANKQSDCNATTHRICGVIDGKDNLLCHPNNIHCPVTSIKFYQQQSGSIDTNSSINSNTTNITNTTNSTNSTDNNATNTTVNSTNLRILDQLDNDITITYQLNNNYSLFISKKEGSSLTDNRIFTFFRTELSKPCLNPTRSPSSEFFFPLMKNKLDLMCDIDDQGQEVTDDMFISLDGYRFDDYFRDNNYYTQVHEVIDPFKLDMSDKTVYLWARAFPGWNVKCQREDPDSLHSFLKTPEVLNGILLSSIFHSFISIAIIIAIGVIACFMSKYFELLFKASTLGFVLFNLIYSIQMISNSNWVINILTDESGAYCGDSVVNTLLVEISSSCLQLQYSYIIILLIAIFCCVVFIYYLYVWISPATREVQESLIEMRR